MTLKSTSLCNLLNPNIELDLELNQSELLVESEVILQNAFAELTF